MPNPPVPSGATAQETDPSEPAAWQLLQALPDPAVILRPAGRDSEPVILLANAAAARLVDLKIEELAGIGAGEWRERVSRVLAPGCAGPNGAERWESRQFKRRILERRVLPFPGPDGSPGQGWSLELLVDVTDCVRREKASQRMERQLEELQGRLDQMERYKFELTANVTHDLRTPLASIKASISGLLAGDVTYNAADIRETLTLVEEECDRLQRRVTNLLSMARMESGDAQLGQDWTDLSDVTASALESLRSIRNGREVRLDFPDDLPLVKADYDQLQIAVRNLVENAFNYSPADKPVEVSARASLGSVRIRVRDYGTGLMPDEFEKVFHKFYRGRSARRIPGTGIGLPICRGIAEAHGGRLWAEHVPGGGVQFVLSIPLTEEELDLEREEAPEMAESEGVPVGELPR